MTFTVPRDSEVPWWVRVVGVAIGVIISGAALLSIIYFGSILRHVYAMVDARREALAEERRLAPDLSKGTVFIVKPEDRPVADDMEEEDSSADGPPPEVSTP